MVLGIRENKLPRGHPVTAGSRSDVGRCAADLGRYDEAERLFLESLDDLEPRKSEMSGRWKLLLERLSALYREQGNTVHEWATTPHKMDIEIQCSGA